MKILIIGDRHSGGHGLAAGELSFVGHFVRQISHTGRKVSVDAFVYSTLSAVRAALVLLPLEQYDLIVLQTGQGCPDHPAGFGSLLIRTTDHAVDLSGELMLPDALSLPPKPIHPLTERFRTMGQLALLKTFAFLGRLPRLDTVRRELGHVLQLLQPYRHKVLVLSPFPQQDPIGRWLRRRGRQLVCQEGYRRNFSVFDTDRVIEPREEYFLPGEAGYLNAIGHELVGRALFDFFLAAPTIVSIHSIRRN